MNREKEEVYINSSFCLHLPSYSLPAPGVSNSWTEKGHRRHATVDCDDTDRSVPRPKDYMYPGSRIDAVARGFSSEAIHEGEQAPSRRQATRYMYPNPIPTDSPLSSGSQGSTHSRSSPTKLYQQPRSSPQGLSGSASSLLPPAPALSHSRRGSYESDVSANNGTQSNPYATARAQLRRTHSRRGLRDEATETQGSNYQVSPTHLTEQYSSSRIYASSNRSQDALGAAQGEAYTRGRSRRGEPSPRRRYSYDASPRRDAVIPDMSILSPINSARNSRYTLSGESSISEPVIPDVSLIMEAEIKRGKGDRVRRRLVPTRSSSEDNGELRGKDDFDLTDSSDDDDDGYVRVDHMHGNEAGNGAYYTRPTRDGYGPGDASENEGQRSRAPSRTPSRPPSRGILKRSSSVCSQRSTKSVRIEIPRDRRALEEVRDAEDKFENARMYNLLWSCFISLIACSLFFRAPA
jgi:hypothetical protein